MIPREWRTQHKTGWPRGEWDQEPDKKQWTDAATGLPCLIVRNFGGALCGYVGVPPGHPDHGTDYGGLDADVDVHGGLTFADACADLSRDAWQAMRARRADNEAEAREYPRGDAAQWLREWGDVLDDYAAWRARAEGRFVCHVPEPGEPDSVWWFGFDCAHLGDRSPAFPQMLPHGAHDWYKGVAFVERWCARLAAQLAARR